MGRKSEVEKLRSLAQMDVDAVRLPPKTFHPEGA